MTVYRSNREPMALATGSPRIAGSTINSLPDRRVSPGANAYGSGGFTLIEAMIAITMTLIIMLALAQGFKRLSDDISQGRARLALSDQLRSVSEVLRNDLANLTVDPDPTSANNKLGYFMYYDGPVTDYTAATLPINTDSSVGATTERLLSASKYGDFDDILTFTAKANGDYFKGRVPLAVVLGAAAAQGGTTYTPTQDHWANSVVMASEFAEIAYFMMPMNIELNADGEAELTEPSINAAGSLVFEDNDVPVSPGSTFNVPSGRPLLPNAGVGNGIPDRMILCRRVMPIIPSLNVPVSGLQQLTNTDSSPPTSLSLRLQASSTGAFAMSSAYQGCDLSVRRTHTSGTVVPVAANSLEDLANPANRFAHTMLTFAANPSTTTTMPILALTPPIPIQEYALSKGAQDFGAGTTGVALPVRPNTTFLDYANPSFSESGFLSPTFLRHKRGLVDHDNNPITPPIVADLGIDLSESLAMNCVGFDIKGFDSSARLLFNAGPDGNAGTAVSPATNGVLGASGTDDLVLSPNDPGYDQSLRYLYALPGFAAAPPSTWDPANRTLANLTASTGCFVDIGWGMKSIFATVAGGILATPLSGRDALGNASFTMKQSGRVLNSGGRNHGVYQPCFDSFTNAFENDGFNQFNGAAGATFVLGTSYLNGSGPPTTLPAGADFAVNGLDDALVDGGTTAANGIVDDLDERDTLPPINFAMPAIQATIRLEDKQASVIQQIAVTQSLVDP